MMGTEVCSWPGTAWFVTDRPKWKDLFVPGPLLHIQNEEKPL